MNQTPAVPDCGVRGSRVGHWWLFVMRGRGRKRHLTDDPAPKPRWAKPPDNYVEVACGVPIFLREWSRSRNKDRNARGAHAEQIETTFKYFLMRRMDQKMQGRKGLGDKSEHTGWTDAQFWEETWEAGVKVSERPIEPFVDDDKDGRPALRINLGQTSSKKQAKFYVSTTLGYAYAVHWTNCMSFDGESLDEFVKAGWEGDHLVDLRTMEVPMTRLAYVCGWIQGIPGRVHDSVTWLRERAADIVTADAELEIQRSDFRECLRVELKDSFTKLEIQRALNGTNTDRTSPINIQASKMWKEYRKKKDQQKVTKAGWAIPSFPWPNCFWEEYKERVLDPRYPNPPDQLEIIDRAEEKEWLPKGVRGTQPYTMRDAWNKLLRKHPIRRVYELWKDQFQYVLDF